MPSFNRDALTEQMRVKLHKEIIDAFDQSEFEIFTDTASFNVKFANVVSQKPYEIQIPAFVSAILKRGVMLEFLDALASERPDKESLQTSIAEIRTAISSKGPRDNSYFYPRPMRIGRSPMTTKDYLRFSSLLNDNCAPETINSILSQMNRADMAVSPNTRFHLEISRLIETARSGEWFRDFYFNMREFFMNFSPEFRESFEGFEISVQETYEILPILENTIIDKRNNLLICGATDQTNNHVVIVQSTATRIMRDKLRADLENRLDLMSAPYLLYSTKQPKSLLLDMIAQLYPIADHLIIIIPDNIPLQEDGVSTIIYFQEIINKIHEEVNSVIECNYEYYGDLKILWIGLLNKFCDINTDEIQRARDATVSAADIQFLKRDVNAEGEIAFTSDTENSIIAHFSSWSREWERADG